MLLEKSDVFKEAVRIVKAGGSPSRIVRCDGSNELRIDNFITIHQHWDDTLMVGPGPDCRMHWHDYFDEHEYTTATEAVAVAFAINARIQKKADAMFAGTGGN